MTSAEPLPARDLAAFVAAIETGSIQGAADALVLTQSAATKRVQRLERRLGVRLLVRGRRGVQPTEAGRVLYPDAKEALLALDRAEQRALAAGADQAGRLRLAASHTIGGFLLPGWLSAFRASVPQAHPQVDVVNSPGVLRRVRDGEADLGFVEGDDDLRGFDRLAVGVDELAVVVGAGHRWARRASVRPVELADEPYSTREPGSGTRSVVEHRLAAGGTVLDPRLEVASTESLKRAVLDAGFTVLSRHAVAGELEAGTLVALPVRGVDLRRELFAVRCPARGRHGAAAQLWAWLQATVPGTGVGPLTA